MDEQDRQKPNGQPPKMTQTHLFDHKYHLGDVKNLQPPHIERRLQFRVDFLGDGDHLYERILRAPHIHGYIIIFAYCLLLILVAFFVDRPHEIWAGSLRIIKSPSKLLTDYTAVGGLGAALLNSGGVTLLTVILLFVRKVYMSGPIMAALFTISGFSLFGKNLYNTLPIMIGTLLYMIIKRIPFAQIVIISLFSTALSPMVSVLSFGLELPKSVGMPLGYIIGILIGLIMPPLATSFLRFHMGFNLYNVGFTAGVIGMVFTGMFRMFNLKIDTVTILSYEYQTQWICLLCTILLFLLAASFVYSNKPWKGYRQIVKQSGQLVTDFTLLNGYALTLFNMALMGWIGLVYLVVIRGTLNGPIIGSWLTMLGFSAFGVHPFNATPVMCGVFLAAIANHSAYNDTSAVLATLFGTTLAPIAGHYGPLSGLLAGFCHMAVVLNVGVVHGGVNLYNNGFSGGFVAAILTPILEDFRRKRKSPKRVRKRTR